MTDIDVAAIERVAVSLRDERNQFRDECSKLADQVGVWKRRFHEMAARLDEEGLRALTLAGDVERLKADRRALDIAVTGLRELETTWANDADAFAAHADDDDAMTADVLREAVRAMSALLDRIGGTR